VISYHNFRDAPRNLPRIAQRIRDSGPDAVKVAAHCDSIADSLRVSQLASHRKDTVAIPMGEAGMPGRILELRGGSALAYAAVERPTAPGQLSLEDMVSLYRAEKLTARTRVFGVIGNPIGHSLSPLLHNTGFSAQKFNGVLAPFLVHDLRDFLKALKPLGIAGFAVTIPHKEAILEHLDGCDPLAAKIGAVNTVVVRGGGRLYGYNTDYTGVLRSLEGHLQLAGSRVLLFGAGGAARAAAFALAQAGAIVSICARRAGRARELARAARGRPVSRGDLRRKSFDVIVNCTPVGMYPHGGSPLCAEELNCRLVMDMVYRPRETELLRVARQRGIETISGVEMFLTQGFAQYEIWTRDRAPEAAIRRVIVAELARAEKSRRESARPSKRGSTSTTARTTNSL
jgi:3-dehydroquinate dehydratase/shikimate dehydrogenase